MELHKYPRWNFFFWISVFRDSLISNLFHPTSKKKKKRERNDQVSEKDTLSGIALKNKYRAQARSSVFRSVFPASPRLSSTRNLEISSDQESCTSNDPRLCTLVAWWVLFICFRAVCHVVEIRASFNGTRMNGYAYRQRKRIDFSLVLLEFFEFRPRQLGENPGGTDVGRGSKPFDLLYFYPPPSTWEI